MTTKEIIALQRLTRLGPYECMMSLGVVGLIPQVDMSWILMYPSYSVPLYIHNDIAGVDRYSLRYMYNEYMSCI